MIKRSEFRVQRSGFGVSSSVSSVDECAVVTEHIHRLR
jgi:hypothetical protein